MHAQSLSLHLCVQSSTATVQLGSTRRASPWIAHMPANSLNCSQLQGGLGAAATQSVHLRSVRFAQAARISHDFFTSFTPLFGVASSFLLHEEHAPTSTQVDKANAKKRRVRIATSH